MNSNSPITSTKAEREAFETLITAMIRGLEDNLGMPTFIAAATVALVVTKGPEWAVRFSAKAETQTEQSQTEDCSTCEDREACFLTNTQIKGTIQ